MDFHQHKAMLAALEAGTATPDQQRAAFAHLTAVKRQHQADLREAERDAREAYSTGRSDAASADRDEPFGTY
jgi:hypothetical protein